MKKLLKLISILIITLLFAQQNSFANDVYFIDYSKVMNESNAGKKAQDTLKKLLSSSNKKFNETAKKLREEENKLISQKNVLDKEEYKKKAEALRKKVFNLNKENEDTNAPSNSFLFKSEDSSLGGKLTISIFSLFSRLNVRGLALMKGTVPSLKHELPISLLRESPHYREYLFLPVLYQLP